MKKILIITSLLFLHNYFCMGQQPKTSNSDNIEDVKIAYMSKELNLTPQEAQKFWPAYESYFSEIREARKNNSNDEVAFEENVVKIRKKYKNNFKGILNSDDRVNKVFVSEKNLRDIFKKELQNRKLKRQGNKPAPPRAKQKN